MTGRTRRRLTILLFLAVGSTVITQCKLSRSEVVAPLIFVGNAERENDTLSGARPGDLGGPSGGGTTTSSPNRPTPELPPGDIANISEAALINHLKKMIYDMSAYGSENGQVKCEKNGIPCPPADYSTVYIQPDIGMNRWKHDDVPPNGLIVARIIDYDTDPSKVEARYGFHAQRHAWWVVDWGPGHVLRSRFIERTYSSTGPAVVVLKNASYSYRDCMHPSHAGRPSRAKWWGCDSAYADTMMPAMLRRTRQAPTSYFRFAAYGPLRDPVAPPPPAPTYAKASGWVSCGEGCCAADP